MKKRRKTEKQTTFMTPRQLVVIFYGKKFHADTSALRALKVKTYKLSYIVSAAAGIDSSLGCNTHLPILTILDTVHGQPP